METYTDFHYTSSNITIDSESSISCMKESNEQLVNIKKQNHARKFILGWILDKITSKCVHIFGSCTRYIISNESFDMIKMCNGDIKDRDIDIVCYKNYHNRVIIALSQIGEIENVTSHKLHYTSLKKRNIRSIQKVKIHVGSSNGTLFSRFINSLGYDEFDMNIDIVELSIDRIMNNNFINKTIIQIMEEWPICDLSRQYVMYSYHGAPILHEIKRNCFKLQRNSLLSIIECLKLSIRVKGDSSSIDRYRYDFNPSKAILQNTCEGRIKRMNLLKNGTTIANIDQIYRFRTFKTYNIKKSISKYIENGKMNDLLHTILTKILNISDLSNKTFVMENISKIKERVDEPCSICLSSTNENKNKILTPCGHLFCLSCIGPQIIKYLEMLSNRVNNVSDDSIPQMGSCPLCRTSLIKNSINLSRIRINRSFGMKDIYVNDSTLSFIK